MALKAVRRIGLLCVVSVCFIFFWGLAVYCAEALYRVESVVDGDTIVLSNGRSVRYLGIDTPEVRRREAGGWKYSPERFALEAKKTNEDLVSGQLVTLEFDRSKEDKYGRLLGYIYVQGKMVNEEMLRRGLAIFALYLPNGKYADKLISAQEEARRAKRGLWSECPAISAGEAARYVGWVVSVRGKVSSVGVGRNSCFLYFETGSQKDLTAVIWKNNIPFFVKEGISPPDSYRGKTIELIGKIKFSKGPEIVVFHPSQIKTIAE